MEKLRLSLYEGNPDAFRRALADFRTAKQRNVLLTADFPCIKAATGMMDEIAPDLFLELCSYCHPEEKFKCVAYAALSQCLPLLRYFLPALESDGKSQLWPLFPILIEEKKYDVIEAFRAEGIVPHRDDLTVWPLVVNSLSMDLLHALLGKNGIPENGINSTYVQPIVSYCERLLADESISIERRNFTETFLSEFGKYCNDTS